MERGAYGDLALRAWIRASRGGKCLNRWCPTAGGRNIALHAALSDPRTSSARSTSKIDPLVTPLRTVPQIVPELSSTSRSERDRGRKKVLIEWRFVDFSAS